MSGTGNYWEKKFWKIPELVEKLITFLDAESVSELAQAHQLTVQVLQGTHSWNKLVRRTCPYYVHRNIPEELDHVTDSDDLFRVWVDERFFAQSIDVYSLAGVLRLMENCKASLLELLHVICERYPPIVYGKYEDDAPEFFQLSCPCKRTHSVSHLGFLLLEEVEGTLGSAAQEVEKVSIFSLEEPWLSALGSRTSRQQKGVIKIKAKRFICTDTDHVDTFLSLQGNCQKLIVWGVEVLGDISPAEGWAKMARACVHLGTSQFFASREDMLLGKREDLRTIWDALVPRYGNLDTRSRFCMSPVTDCGAIDCIKICLETEEKEAKWRILEEILDKPADQWSTVFVQNGDWWVVAESQEGKHSGGV